MSQTEQTPLWRKHCPNCGTELPADAAKRTKWKRRWIVCYASLFGLAILAMVGSIIFRKQLGVIGMAFGQGIMIACLSLNAIFCLQQEDLAAPDT